MIYAKILFCEIYILFIAIINCLFVFLLIFMKTCRALSTHAWKGWWSAGVPVIGCAAECGVIRL